VNWKGVKSELTASQNEIKNALTSQTQLAGVDGNKIKDVVLKSLKQTANSIFKVNVTAGDDANDNDDELNVGSLTAPSGAGTKVRAHNRVQSEKTRQRVLEASRKADSIKKVYSRLKINRVPATELYTAINKQFDLQADANAYQQATVNGYSTNYVPVKFDENLPYNLSVGAANNVTVTSKGNSTLIAVKEDKENVDSYKKKITIETLDSTGQKHVFHVTFEMYQ